MRLDWANVELRELLDAGSRHDHRRPSRRTMLKTIGGGLAAAYAAPRVLGERAAVAAGYDDPRPIPGGLALNGTGFHVWPVGRRPDDSTMILEPSTITDFRGVIGIAECQGTGVGVDATTGQKIPLTYDTDMRWFQGTYVAEDGRARQGTFGFV